MIQPYHIYIERTDISRNMARFYTLSIEPDLFGGAALVRRWGRIGTGGQSRIDLHADEAEAVLRFLALLSAKRRRGYRPTRYHPTGPAVASSAMTGPTMPPPAITRSGPIFAATALF